MRRDRINRDNKTFRLNGRTWFPIKETRIKLWRRMIPAGGFINIATIELSSKAVFNIIVICFDYDPTYEGG